MRASDQWQVELLCRLARIGVRRNRYKENWGSFFKEAATQSGMGCDEYSRLTTLDSFARLYLLALAAKLAGKGLSVYLDSPSHTCASFPDWSGGIRHMRIL
jgi:hypothetical protein